MRISNADTVEWRTHQLLGLESRVGRLSHLKAVRSAEYGSKIVLDPSLFVVGSLRS